MLIYIISKSLLVILKRNNYGRIFIALFYIRLASENSNG